MHQSDSGPLRRPARARVAVDVHGGRRVVQRWLAAVVMITVCGLLTGCGGGGSGTGATNGSTVAAAASGSVINSGGSGGSMPDTNSGLTNKPTIATARVLPTSPVWAVYYGRGSAIDIARTAATFNVIVIDADPGTGTPPFSATQISALKAHGAKVLSYLNLGACEKSRTYWNSVPPGFVSCGANTSAQIGRYSGFQEYWMNPANADYQNLIVNYVAPRLAATGVDGFMLDNFEIVGHGANASSAPCNAACAQGGLDLVKQLRDRFPNLAMVPNAAPVSVIGGTTGGVSFPWLIDGVIAEQVFLPSTSASIVQLLKSWQSTEQNLGRSAFLVGSLDYAPSCTASSTAQTAWTAAQQAGFSPSVSTISLDSICWWSFLPVSS